MLEELIHATEGFELCGVSDSAEDTLRRLEQARIELALIDVSLPGMDGIELVAEILRRNRSIRCVMLSGHRSPSYAERARAAGAEAYVEKGDTRELIEILRKVLAGHSGFTHYSRRSRH